MCGAVAARPPAAGVGGDDRADRRGGDGSGAALARRFACGSLAIPTAIRKRWRSRLDEPPPTAPPRLETGCTEPEEPKRSRSRRDRRRSRSQPSNVEPAPRLDTASRLRKNRPKSRPPWTRRRPRRRVEAVADSKPRRDQASRRAGGNGRADYPDTTRRRRDSDRPLLPPVTDVDWPPVGDPNGTSPYCAPQRTGPAWPASSRRAAAGRRRRAVAAALQWLAAAQSRDGRWDASHFGAGQEQMVLGQNRGGAGRNADTGISALAMLAFLGAGHSHVQRRVSGQRTPRPRLSLRSQADDGSLYGEVHALRPNVLPLDGDIRAGPSAGDDGRQTARAGGRQSRSNLLRAAATSVGGGWRYRPEIRATPANSVGRSWSLASTARAGDHSSASNLV